MKAKNKNVSRLPNTKQTEPITCNVVLSCLSDFSFVTKYLVTFRILPLTWDEEKGLLGKQTLKRKRLYAFLSLSHVIYVLYLSYGFCTSSQSELGGILGVSLRGIWTVAFTTSIIIAGLFLTKDGQMVTTWASLKNFMDEDFRSQQDGTINYKSKQTLLECYYKLVVS